MDIFGVVILGLITATAGGLIRDLILGDNPPDVLDQPVYAILACMVSVVVFFPLVRKNLKPDQAVIQTFMSVMDTVGLGIFTVIGVWKAYEIYPDSNMFLSVSVGAITGVGGGVLRDLFSGETPYIFTKHIYALASIAGGICCAVLRLFLNDFLTCLISMLVIGLIRTLAIKFKWNLPKPE